MSLEKARKEGHSGAKVSDRRRAAAGPQIADGFRIRGPLLPNDPAVWNSAVMGGIFVRIGHVEISHDELLSMAARRNS